MQGVEEEDGTRGLQLAVNVKSERQDLSSQSQVVGTQVVLMSSDSLYLLGWFPFL